MKIDAKLEDALTTLTEECLENLWSEAHSIAKTENGDMTFDQTFRYDGLRNEIAALLIEQINDNL